MQRVRTRGKFVGPTQVQATITGPGATSYTAYFDKRKSGDLQTTVDFVTPGFHRLQKEGKVINNPYSTVLESRFPSLGSVTFVPSNPLALPTMNYVGDFLGWSWPENVFAGGMTNVDENSLINLATVKARGNISRADILSLVSIKERQQTIDLVADLAKRIRTVIFTPRRLGDALGRMVSRNLNDRRIRTFIPSLGKKMSAAERRTLANAVNVKQMAGGKPSSTVRQLLESNWLQVRYGILPSIYDVQGALKALDRITPIRATARGTATSVVPFQTTYAFGSSVGNCQPWSVSEAGTNQHKARAYVLYTVDAAFDRAHAWGLTDIPESIWEAAYLSFVVDWVVNIGDWIAAMTPKVGVIILAEGCTVEHIYNGERKILSYTPTVSYPTVNGLIGLHDGSYYKAKRRYTSLPVLTTPTFKVKLNTERALDSIALLGQIYGPRKSGLRI